MVSVRQDWRAVALGLGILAAAAAGAANAGVIYQSATNSGADSGDYILSSNNLIGAEFSVTSSTVVTAIGAQFGNPFDPDPGTIFGAIVPVASLSDFPAGSSADLASISLADVVFSAPNPGDLMVALSAPVTLAAGSYAVIFGSGQFGATGFAALGDENNPVGSPVTIQSAFSPGWASLGDPGVRIVVDGVPEPASWGLMIAGFGGMGALLRRRKTALSAA
ncbi:PEPxxWA-CTERM sorting domain-containing protein [Phenylobacterium sp.]|uniref:PEPxxWA-CTERM sorting domain-containing protein n=1 Tax=Phenylobacterium sp. TaxID=1871053 RepID=UPI001222E0AC|nr:PEPxxWA-CTERM sorting domain-containing protein [Phenylobacterium sp.]THD57912.1 MAG: PEP-CTERM sorting domain-containing protein [Phenylobacterium sp.]